MKIALGPLLYYWQRDAVFAFYEEIATTALDVVYLGETVCSRRHELRLSDWIDLGQRLRAAGKEVVLSTQVLLESGAELGTMHRIVANGDFLVEANDMGAVQCLTAAKLPFVAGPHLNIYNQPTLHWIASLGATRWVIPLEMARSALALLQAERPVSMQTEVFAYGRMPLAFSARCFTARQRNLPKDDCRFSCLDHPDGLLLNTREHEQFLVLNGIQTQSAKVYNLAPALDDMAALGVDLVRISPQAQHSAEVVAIFDALRHHTLGPQQAQARLQAVMPAASCDGYWHGHPGLDQVETLQPSVTT